MNEYLKAHRLLPAAGLATLVTLVGWWLAGTAVPLPQLVSGLASPVELQLFATVVMAPLTVWTFDEEVLRLEASSRRRLWVLDLAVLAALVGPSCLLAAAATAAGEGAHTVELARNTVLFVGLAFLCHAAAGQTAALVIPVAYFLAMGTAGSRRDGTHQPWAFPADGADPRTVGLSLTLFALGFLAFAVRRRRGAGSGPSSGRRAPAAPSRGSRQPA